MVNLTSTNGFFGATAGNALEYEFSDISWSDSGSGSFGVSGDAGIAGAGLTMNGSYFVGMSLTGVAHLDLGSMDNALDLDTSTGIENGDGLVAAHVNTANFTITSQTLDATGPDAAESYIELGAGAVLSVDAKVEANAWYDIGIDSGETSGTLFEGNLVNLDITVPLIPHTTLADLGGLDGNVLTVALGDYFEAKIDIPEFTYDEVEHTAVEGKPDELHLHGESSPFASIEFGLASFLELGPWGLEMDLGILHAGIEVGLFDAKLVSEVSLVQDVNATSDIQYSMTTSLGETLTGNMGDDVVFDTPEGEGDFTVTADYSLVETVESIMSVKVGTFIDWKLLFGTASIGIPIISEKWETEVTALDGRVDLGDLLGLSVSFEWTHDTTVYISDAGQEIYTIHYENFVTEASGKDLTLTTHQISAIGGDIANLIVGNGLANELDGGAGNDTLSGGDGDDTLDGGLGNDTMFGGAGDDVYIVDSKLDSVAEGRDGTDTVVTSLKSYILGNHIENLLFTGDIAQNGTGNALGNEISGTDHNNVIVGLAGDDTLFGFGGNDNLSGGSGDDVLNGGRGMDKLSGGKGEDVFVFNSGDSAVGKTRDVITDFHSHLSNQYDVGDALDMSGFESKSSLSERQSFAFIGSNAFHDNGQGEVRFQNGIVYGDSDGNGIADFEIALKGVRVLIEADFIW